MNSKTTNGDCHIVNESGLQFFLFFQFTTQHSEDRLSRYIYRPTLQVKNLIRLTPLMTR